MIKNLKLLLRTIIQLAALPRLGTRVSVLYWPPGLHCIQHREWMLGTVVGHNDRVANVFEVILDAYPESDRVISCDVQKEGSEWCRIKKDKLRTTLVKVAKNKVIRP